MTAPLLSVKYHRVPEVIATWGDRVPEGAYIVLHERKCLCAPDIDHGSHYYAYHNTGKYTRHSAVYLGVADEYGNRIPTGDPAA